MKVEMKYFERNNTLQYRYLVGVPEKLEGKVQVGDQILVTSRGEGRTIAKVVDLNPDLTKNEYRDHGHVIEAVIKAEFTNIEDRSEIYEKELELNSLRSQYNDTYRLATRYVKEPNKEWQLVLDQIQEQIELKDLELTRLIRK